MDEVRFATTSVGWAYGPALFRTANGGRTWAAQPVPGHGHQVLALGHSAAANYAVVSPCREFAACTGGHLTLWRTASPSGDLLVGAWSEGTFMYANEGGKAKWTMPLGLDTADGWNDLAFAGGQAVRGGRGRPRPRS
ncbi:MAG: hypothetical protein ACRDPO_16015 [Streptosporangiaceae bacterium]